MHLLAREEMGLRCLLRVALEGRSGDPVPITLIAAEEGISAVYAAKLMRRLRLAGLVDSIRGAAGGYRLTRSADAISVWDAIHALDENFLPGATCNCQPEDRADCRRTTDCAVSSLWRRIGNEVHHQLASITLAELCAGSTEGGGQRENVSLPVVAAGADRTSTAEEIERTTAWPLSN